MMSRQTRGRGKKWKSRYQNKKNARLSQGPMENKSEAARRFVCDGDGVEGAWDVFFFFASEGLTARVRVAAQGEFTSMAGKIEAIISVWAGSNKGSRPMI